MTDTVPKWQALVPGDLPARHLDLMFRHFNPKEALTLFDFAGFTKMQTGTDVSSTIGSTDTVFYSDSYSAEKSFAVTGRNYYGPLFFIEIGKNSIGLENYCLEDEQCQQTAMKLLKHLALEFDLKFQWQAYSWYYDNHERSELNKGTEVEIRGLFCTDASP
jgi:hypothetical protein